MDVYYVACYWWGRTESDEQFARRTADWFRELSLIDRRLQRWYEVGKSARSRVEFSPTAEVLYKLFTSKKYSRAPMGVLFGAWNGRDKPERFFTNMGADWMPGGYPALCILDPPREGKLAESILTVESLSRFLHAMIRVWDPDLGVATSREFRNASEDPGASRAIQCGWLTYFSRRRGSVPPLPAPIRIEPVDDKGTLIILSPERVTASNPSHVALGKQVQRILDRAGMLGRGPS